MRETYSISFYCRECKVSKKNGLAPIEMAININSKRTFINLPRKEVPATFTKAMTSKRGNSTKEFTNLYYIKVNNIILQLLKEGKPLVPQTIKEMLQGKEEKKLTVLEAWNNYIKSLTKRVDVDMALTTFRKYVLTKEYFLSKINPDTPIEDVTREEVEEIYLSLKREKSINTAEKYMVKIKSFFKFNKIVDIFEGMKFVKEKTEIETFTSKDYNKVKKASFNMDSLNTMRDIFIFCCNSGLSYIDIANLKKEDIRVDDKGSVTIVKPRHKTGVTFYSVVLKDGVEVLKKYDYNIPKISNQVGNRLLHIIEGICGTSTPITFHRCRHYYCTQLIACGVPLSIVQKCMGHSKALMTMHYTHLVEDDVKKEVLNKIKQKREAAKKVASLHS